ncbi:MAG: hypothetical protein D6690_07770 [Nitrospirae bacterium]|nr:MAG: hypothetical protein D6690_07770 [Nitrospirota bacterium]
MRTKMPFSLMVISLVCMAFLASGLVSNASAGLLTEQYEVVMKDYKFHITKEGNPVNGIELTGGVPTVIVLRNEDPVAHEFVSSLFARVPVAMSGDATLVSTKRARGFRINPGQSVRLEFVPPINEEGDTEYDVFWCNIHGKHPGAEMKGEIFVVQTTTGTGAF